MLITYRRTGGVFSLIMIAAALVAVAIAVVVGATLLAVGVALGAVALLVRSVLPQSWRRSTPAAATPWPQETIEGTIVKPEDSSDEHNLLTGGRT